MGDLERINRYMDNDPSIENAIVQSDQKQK